MSTMTETSTVEMTYEELRATEAQSPTGPAASFSYSEVAAHYAYTLPENALRFDNIADMRRKVNASGSHYFDADAIRFFRGKTDTHMIAGRFWVESRKYVNDFSGHESPREYQVAWVSEYNGSLSVEKLGSFDTLDKARRAAKRLSESLDNES